MLDEGHFLGNQINFITGVKGLEFRERTSTMLIQAGRKVQVSFINYLL